MAGLMSRLPKLRFKEPQTEEEGTIYLLMPTLVLVTALIVSAAAGIGFTLIAGSDVHIVLVVFSTAVLCLLPAFFIKAVTALTGYADRAMLTVMTALGFIAAILPVSAYYVSHDYELSVYRYMRVTRADDYYYGGYDALTEDYASPEDFAAQMMDTPASIVLDSMSIEKMGKLSPEQLETIRSENLWDYFGFGEILGSASDEIEDSLAASRTMNAYEFTFEYRGLTAKSFFYMMKNPGVIVTEIGDILRTGSHSIEPFSLLIYLLGEAFSVYMICMHFGVNDKNHIVYYTRPAPPVPIIAFAAAIYDGVAEMKNSWRIREEPGEAETAA